MMSASLKPYIYKKGMNPALDAQFSAAVDYGWVKPGQTAVFWKTGLRWYAISLSEVERIFRRVVPVYGKVCCGGRSFIMEYLVIIRKDGSELELYIGDDMEKKSRRPAGFPEANPPGACLWKAVKTLPAPVLSKNHFPIKHIQEVLK